MNGSVIARLLRAPADVARQCLAEDNVQALVGVSLACIAAGGALFGATLGMSRGGIQVLYAGVKLPMAFVATLIVCVPAFYAFANLYSRTWSMRSTVSLVLAATARSCLVLVAFVPVLMLAIDTGVGYHAVAFWSAVAYGLSGLAALGIILRALGLKRAAGLLALTFVTVFGLTGGQTAWTLRPYLGRPSQASVPFLRAPDGTFVRQVVTSGKSSVGIYDEVREADRSPDENHRGGPR